MRTSGAPESGCQANASGSYGHGSPKQLALKVHRRLGRYTSTPNEFNDGTSDMSYSEGQPVPQASEPGFIPIECPESRSPPSIPLKLTRAPCRPAQCALDFAYSLWCRCLTHPHPHSRRLQEDLVWSKLSLLSQRLWRAGPANPIWLQPSNALPCYLWGPS